jgi:ABC-2 type transport system permease protein
MATSVVIRRSPGLRTVFAKTLRDQRRSLLWWAIAAGLVVLMYSAFYPSIVDNAAQFDEYMKSLPKAVRDMLGGSDITSPEGYLMSEIFGFMGPVLLMVYSIGAGSRAIAGEEEAGTLDLLLSAPVRRRTVVSDKFGAMALGTFVIAGTMWLVTTIAGPAFDLTVPLDHLTAAYLNLFLLALGFGAIAFAVGAATGSRGLAIGVAAGTALATFLLKTFASTVEWLEPFRVLSPFWYYTGHDPLRNGFHASDPIMLASISVVALAIALVTLERRDLTA